MGKNTKMETVKYYTIERVEGQELAVNWRLQETSAQSPKYVWDLNGETKILSSYIDKIEKQKKTGKPIPFYYAVLFDGQELPLAIAQEK